MKAIWYKKAATQVFIINLDVAWQQDISCVFSNFFVTWGRYQVSIHIKSFSLYKRFLVNCYIFTVNALISL